MAKHLVDVIDAAGIVRHVKAVDAREIEAVAQGKLVEVPIPAEPSAEGESKAYPKNFPGSAVLEREGIGYHAALRMTRDELIAVDGIGAGTADKILKQRVV